MFYWNKHTRSHTYHGMLYSARLSMKKNKTHRHCNCIPTAVILACGESMAKTWLHYWMQGLFRAVYLKTSGFFPTLWMYTCWCNSLCSRWTVCTKHSQDILTSVSPSLAIRYPWDVGRDSEYSSKPAAWEMCFSTDTTFVVDDESKQRAARRPHTNLESRGIGMHWQYLTMQQVTCSVIMTQRVDILQVSQALLELKTESWNK